MRTGQKFKDKTSLLTLNLFNGQTGITDITPNLVRDNKHGRRIARTRPTLRMFLVPSPSEQLYTCRITEQTI